MCALHQAVRIRNKRQIQILINMKVDVNKSDREGRTALMAATELNICEETIAVQIASLLLKHGAKITLKDRDGINALSHACANEREKLVTLFLREKRVDLNDIDSDGNTCLHYAVEGGNFNIVKMVAYELAFYRLCFDVFNRRGETALILAAKLKREDLCGILEDYSPASRFVRDLKYFKTAEEWKRTNTITVSDSFCKRFPLEVTRIRDCVDQTKPRYYNHAIGKLPHLNITKQPLHPIKHPQGRSLIATLPDIFSLYDGKKNKNKKLWKISTLK